MAEKGFLKLMVPATGEVLAGKYQLVSLLGKGGMGSVWRAEHLALKSPVAVKLIDPVFALEAEAASRFLREAQSAAALRSPHVVQILDYGLDGDTPYIVMELMEGESLADRLARVGRLSPQETGRVITDVCRAVSRAHEAGIVHRDLKPDNVFIVRNDDMEIAKVLDFGIAKTAAPGMSMNGGTRTGSMLGTPYYMSPEQAGASKTVDFRTDLWALGVIAYECLTGVRPFNSDTLGGLVLAICIHPLPIPSQSGMVPVGFDVWFSRATARNSELRFQSARELAQSLRVVCGLEAGALPQVPLSPNLPTQRMDVGVAPLASTTDASSFKLATGSAPVSEPRSGGGLGLVFAAGGLAMAVLLAGGVAIGWWYLNHPTAAPSLVASAGVDSSNRAGAGSASPRPPSTDTQAQATPPAASATLGTGASSAAAGGAEGGAAPATSGSGSSSSPAGSASVAGGNGPAPVGPGAGRGPRPRIPGPRPIVPTPVANPAPTPVVNPGTPPRPTADPLGL